MKISINNFKSIKSLKDYEIKPLTILSGVNSSGKSSFIQLLLLLKQTIEIDSSQHNLFLKGELFAVKEYIDIVRGKKLANTLKVSFLLTKDEFNDVTSNEVTVFNAFGDYSCRIGIEFDFKQGNVFIKVFSITFLLPKGVKKEQFINFVNNGTSFTIETNTGAFDDFLFYNPNYLVNRINYLGLYPSNYTVSSTIGVQGETRIPKIDGVKFSLNKFFKNLRYIGPLREQPKDEYDVSSRADYVGVKGQFVAEVLESHSSDIINYYYISQFDDGHIEFKSRKSSLISAVKYWMCDVFTLCKDIYAIKNSDSYTIYVESPAGVKSTIKHVGFGISQILPIVVEGLRLQDGETFLLEQPEIHLHPKIQSRLFDFLYSLSESGKHIILETHSDHLITRLRRRIAEDNTDKLKDNINLTFIKGHGEDLIFESISLDEFGTAIFPDNFIENPELELKAIVKAQMKKRINRK